VDEVLDMSAEVVEVLLVAEKDESEVAGICGAFVVFGVALTMEEPLITTSKMSTAESATEEHEQEK
jgi:hypothetical protein